MGAPAATLNQHSCIFESIFDEQNWNIIAGTGSFVQRKKPGNLQGYQASALHDDVQVHGLCGGEIEKLGVIE